MNTANNTITENRIPGPGETQLLEILFYIQDHWIEKTVAKYQWEDIMLQIIKTIEAYRKIEKQEINIQELIHEVLSGKLKSSSLKLLEKIRDVSWKRRLVDRTAAELIRNFWKLKDWMDINTMKLNKNWFNRILSKLYRKLVNWEIRSLWAIIFDQNNLKDINETHWHDIWQKTIYEFGKIIHKVLKEQWMAKNENVQPDQRPRFENYYMSNYYWWDEWFVLMVDITSKEIEKIVSLILKEIQLNPVFISIWEKIWKQKSSEMIKIFIRACAWISYLKGTDIINYLWNEQTTEWNIKSEKQPFDPEFIINTADQQVILAKTFKKTTKNWCIKRFSKINPENIGETLKEFKTINKTVRKLKPSSLKKKTIWELEKIRTKLRTKLSEIRTTYEKKITNENIELLNEIINEKRNKIIDAIIDKLEQSILINKEQDDIVIQIIDQINSIKSENSKELEWILRTLKSLLDTNKAQDSLVEQILKKIDELRWYSKKST